MLFLWLWWYESCCIILSLLPNHLQSYSTLLNLWSWSYDIQSKPCESKFSCLHMSGKCLIKHTFLIELHDNCCSDAKLLNAASVWHFIFFENSHERVCLQPSEVFSLHEHKQKNPIAAEWQVSHLNLGPKRLRIDPQGETFTRHSAITFSPSHVLTAETLIGCL